MNIYYHDICKKMSYSKSHQVKNLDELFTKTEMANIFEENKTEDLGEKIDRDSFMKSINVEKEKEEKKEESEEEDMGFGLFD